MCVQEAVDKVCGSKIASSGSRVKGLLFSQVVRPSIALARRNNGYGGGLHDTFKIPVKFLINIVENPVFQAPETVADRTSPL
jgi:hypothetical protein